MKNLLIAVVLIAVVLVAVGLQRGWFRFGADSAADTANVSVSVDKSKLEADKDKAVGKVHDLGRPAR